MAQNVPVNMSEQANMSTDIEMKDCGDEGKGRRDSDVAHGETSTDQRQNENNTTGKRTQKILTGKRARGIKASRNKETGRRKRNMKLTRNKASANQADVNPSTEIEESGQITTGSIRNVIQTMSNDCRSSFKMDKFWYALIFGLLPTAWDVHTDISWGDRLWREGRVYAAALCWTFVCCTPAVAISEYISKVTNSALAGLVAEASLAASFLSLVMWYPSATYYPAFFIMIGLLIIKILAVFLHTPGITKLSAKLTLDESRTEASLQLLLRECFNRGICLFKDKLNLYDLKIKINFYKTLPNYHFKESSPDL